MNRGQTATRGSKAALVPLSRYARPMERITNMRTIMLIKINAQVQAS